MNHDLNLQATLSVSAATTPLAFSKFAIASLHDVDFAIAECKVAGLDQAHNMHRDFSGIGQADIGLCMTEVTASLQLSKRPGRRDKSSVRYNIEIPAKAKGWHT